MSTRRLVCIAHVIPFLTAYVVETFGLLGFYEMLRSASTVLASANSRSRSDGLIACWMYGDAHETGTPFLPYAVVTALLGVAGPLLYLVHREALKTRRATGRHSQGQRA